MVKEDLLAIPARELTLSQVNSLLELYSDSLDSVYRNRARQTLKSVKLPFAIFCINPQDPGICEYDSDILNSVGSVRFKEGSPVIGSFQEVYDWWKTCGGKLPCYHIRAFADRNRAATYDLNLRDAYPFKALRKPRKSKVPHITKSLESVYQSLRGILPVTRSFKIMEILPLVMVSEKAKKVSDCRRPVIYRKIRQVLTILLHQGIIKETSLRKVYWYYPSAQ